MGFFDDVNEVLDTADAEQEENPYLADPKKGLELIAKLLPDNQKKTSTDKIAGRLDYMLDNEILLTLKDLGKNTLALSRQLTRLSDKIMEYKKVRLLSGKSIVAIVGRFSAGKSGFINSLTTHHFTRRPKSDHFNSYLYCRRSKGSNSSLFRRANNRFGYGRNASDDAQIF